MKKLLLAVAIAALGLTNIHAQEEESVFGFEEDYVFIEGSIGFANKNDENTDIKSNSILFSPKIGYFLNDDLAVGIFLGFNKYRGETGTRITTDELGYTGGVFARYYFLDLGKRFKTYSELGAGYGISKDEIADLKTDTIGAGLDLGINYFVTKKIALAFGLKKILSFSSAKSDVSGAKAISELNFGFGDVANPFGGNATLGLIFKL